MASGEERAGSEFLPIQRGKVLEPAGHEALVNATMPIRRWTAGCGIPVLCDAQDTIAVFEDLRID